MGHHTTCRPVLGTTKPGRPVTPERHWSSTLMTSEHRVPFPPINADLSRSDDSLPDLDDTLTMDDSDGGRRGDGCYGNCGGSNVRHSNELAGGYRGLKTVDFSKPSGSRNKDRGTVIGPGKSREMTRHDKPRAVSCHDRPRDREKPRDVTRPEKSRDVNCNDKPRESTRPDKPNDVTRYARDVARPDEKSRDVARPDEKSRDVARPDEKSRDVSRPDKPNKASLPRRHRPVKAPPSDRSSVGHYQVLIRPLTRRQIRQYSKPHQHRKYLHAKRLKRRHSDSDTDATLTPSTSSDDGMTSSGVTSSDVQNNTSSLLSYLFKVSEKKPKVSSRSRGDDVTRRRDDVTQRSRDNDVKQRRHEKESKRRQHDVTSMDAIQNTLRHYTDLFALSSDEDNDVISAPKSKRAKIETSSGSESSDFITRPKSKRAKIETSSESESSDFITRPKSKRAKIETSSESESSDFITRPTAKRIKIETSSESESMKSDKSRGKHVASHHVKGRDERRHKHVTSHNCHVTSHSSRGTSHSSKMTSRSGSVASSSRHVDSDNRIVISSDSDKSSSRDKRTQPRDRHEKSRDRHGKSRDRHEKPRHRFSESSDHHGHLSENDGKSRDHNKISRDHHSKSRDHNKISRQHSSESRDHGKSSDHHVHSSENDVKTPHNNIISRQHSSESRDHHGHSSENDVKSRDHLERPREHSSESRDHSEHSNHQSRHSSDHRGKSRQNQSRESRGRSSEPRGRSSESRGRSSESRGRSSESRGHSKQSRGHTRDKPVKFSDNSTDSSDNNARQSPDEVMKSRDRDVTSRDRYEKSRDRDEKSRDSDEKSRDRDKKSRDRDEKSRDRDEKSRDRRVPEPLCIINKGTATCPLYISSDSDSRSAVPTTPTTPTAPTTPTTPTPTTSNTPKRPALSALREREILLPDRVTELKQSASPQPQHSIPTAIVKPIRWVQPGDQAKTSQNPAKSDKNRPKSQESTEEQDEKPDVDVIDLDTSRESLSPLNLPELNDVIKCDVTKSDIIKTETSVVIDDVIATPPPKLAALHDLDVVIKSERSDTPIMSDVNRIDVKYITDKNDVIIIDPNDSELPDLPAQTDDITTQPITYSDCLQATPLHGHYDVIPHEVLPVNKRVYFTEDQCSSIEGCLEEGGNEVFLNHAFWWLDYAVVEREPFAKFTRRVVRESLLVSPSAQLSYHVHASLLRALHLHPPLRKTAHDGEFLGAVISHLGSENDQQSLLNYSLILDYVVNSFQAELFTRKLLNPREVKRSWVQTELGTETSTSHRHLKYVVRKLTALPHLAQLKTSSGNARVSACNVFTQIGRLLELVLITTPTSKSQDALNKMSECLVTFAKTQTEEIKTIMMTQMTSPVLRRRFLEIYKGWHRIDDVVESVKRKVTEKSVQRVCVYLEACVAVARGDLNTPLSQRLLAKTRQSATHADQPVLPIPTSTLDFDERHLSEIISCVEKAARSRPELTPYQWRLEILKDSLFA